MSKRISEGLVSQAATLCPPLLVEVTPAIQHEL
jgi:hypothetical protein